MIREEKKVPSFGVHSGATLQVEPGLLKGVGMNRVHLFFGRTVFLLFPFARLVHVWRVPLSYPGRACQIVRVKRMTMN